MTNLQSRDLLPVFSSLVGQLKGTIKRLRCLLYRPYKCPTQCLQMLNPEKKIASPALLLHTNQGSPIKNYSGARALALALQVLPSTPSPQVHNQKVPVFQSQVELFYHFYPQRLTLNRFVNTTCACAKRKYNPLNYQLNKILFYNPKMTQGNPIYLNLMTCPIWGPAQRIEY